MQSIQQEKARNRGRPNDKRTVAGLALLAMGLFMIIIMGPVWVYPTGEDFTKTAVSTTGTIIDMNYIPDGSGSYLPTIQFSTLQGQEQRGRDSRLRQQTAFTLGQPVDVLYNPEDPRVFITTLHNSSGSFTPVDLPTLLFVGFGVTLIMVGLYIAFGIRTLLIVGSGFLTIGSAFLISLVWVHVEQQAFATIAVQTTGTVSDLRVYSDSKTASRRTTSTTYAPMIQFSTLDGQLYTYVSNLYSNIVDFKLGEKVDILYNPKNPKLAVIASDNFILTNSFMLIVGGVGIIFVILGITAILVRPIPQSPPPATKAH